MILAWLAQIEFTDLMQVGGGAGGAVVLALGYAIAKGKNGDKVAATLATLATKIEAIDTAIGRLDNDFRVQFKKYDLVHTDVTIIKAKMEACQACKES